MMVMSKRSRESTHSDSEGEYDEDDYENNEISLTSGVKDRKRRRGIIEKRRRDRINNSLAELKRLVPQAFEKQGSNKLEKAEILQMTVDYLKNVSEPPSCRGTPQTQMNDSPAKAPGAPHNFHVMGFRDCAAEIGRYLTEVEGLDTSDPFRMRLMSHLQCFQAQQNSVESTGPHEIQPGLFFPPANNDRLLQPQQPSTHLNPTQQWMPNASFSNVQEIPGIGITTSLPQTGPTQAYQKSISLDINSNHGNKEELLLRNVMPVLPQPVTPNNSFLPPKVETKMEFPVQKIDMPYEQSMANDPGVKMEPREKTSPYTGVLRPSPRHFNYSHQFIEPTNTSIDQSHLSTNITINNDILPPPPRSINGQLVPQLSPKQVHQLSIFPPTHSILNGTPQYGVNSSLSALPTNPLSSYALSSGTNNLPMTASSIRNDLYQLENRFNWAQQASLPTTGVDAHPPGQSNIVDFKSL